jgi:hypothetical protein
MAKEKFSIEPGYRLSILKKIGKFQDMKTSKFICTLLIVVVFYGCNSNDDKKAEVTEEEVVTDTSSSVSASSDSMQTIVNRSIIWTVDQQNPGKEKLKKPEAAMPDSVSSVQLIEALNNNFPEIHLDFLKISHDTMYVDIPDSKRLSRELGNTGAENYMASATYTLTELKNVKFVNFKFTPGEHAEPGTYSRDDFKRLR